MTRLLLSATIARTVTMTGVAAHTLTINAGKRLAGGMTVSASGTVIATIAATNSFPHRCLENEGAAHQLRLFT